MRGKKNKGKERKKEEGGVILGKDIQVPFPFSAFSYFLVRLFLMFNKTNDKANTPSILF